MSVKYKIKKYLVITRIKRAVTSRIISLIITFFVGWLLTGNIAVGVLISSVDTVFKLLLYYIHETIWEKKITKDIKQIKKTENKKLLKS